MIPPHYCIFVIISPLNRTWSFLLTNMNTLHPRIFCTKFDWNWPAGSGEKDFFFNINTCKYGSPYCGPSQPPGSMIWTNLNLHFIRKLSCKYELFWLSGSWEDLEMTPPHYCILWLSPLWRAPGSLFEHIEFGLLVMEKKIFNNFQCIFTLLLLSPLKGVPLYLNKIEFPPPQGWIVRSVVKIGPVVLEKKSKM
jgi:hypothetical protein